MNDDIFQIVEWVDSKGNSRILIHQENSVDYPFPTDMGVVSKIRLTRQQIKDMLPHLKVIVGIGELK